MRDSTPTSPTEEVALRPITAALAEMEDDVRGLASMARVAQRLVSRPGGLDATEVRDLRHIAELTLNYAIAVEASLREITGSEGPSA